MRSPCITPRVWPPLAATREKPVHHWRPVRAKNQPGKQTSRCFAWLYLLRQQCYLENKTAHLVPVNKLVKVNSSSESIDEAGLEVACPGGSGQLPRGADPAACRAPDISVVSVSVLLLSCLFPDLSPSASASSPFQGSSSLEQFLSHHTLSSSTNRFTQWLLKHMHWSR